MPRRMMASALFGVGLLAVVALGQQPMSPRPEQKPVEKKAKPADAAVAAALANDPDVQVARAKVQLAEAELAKAKQAVVLKVVTLSVTIDEQRRAVAAAQEREEWAARLYQTGKMTQAELLDGRAKLESAQAALARAETELKLLTGGGKKPGIEFIPDDAHDPAVASGMRWLLSADQGVEAQRATARALAAWKERYSSAHGVKGPIPDRIRKALDKPVKFSTGEEVISIEKALEVFKKLAGLDVAVTLRAQMNFVPIQTRGEELPVGAWFQMFADNNPGFIIAVREYGLLITRKDEAPPDAVTIVEFWKQKPAAAKKDVSPEDKK